MVLENCTAAADIISYCGVGGVCDNRTATCFCEVGFWHDAHTWGKAICVEKPPAASNVTSFVSLFLLLFLGKMTRMYVEEDEGVERRRDVQKRDDSTVVPWGVPCSACLCL